MDRSDNKARQPMVFANQEPGEAPLNQSGVLNIRQVWRLFKFNQFFIASLVILTVSATLLHSFFSTPVYKSSVTVSVSPLSAARQVSDVVSGFSEQEVMMNKVNLLSELFETPEVADEVTRGVLENNFGPLLMISKTGVKRFLTNLGIVKPESLTEALRTRPRLEVANEVMSHLRLHPDANGTAVIIDSTTASPELSAFLANKAAEALMHMNQRVGMKRTLEMHDFLTRQAAEMGRKLKDLEERLTDFQAKNFVINVDEAEKETYHAMTENSQQQLVTEMLLKTNENLITSVKAEMKKVKDNIADPALATTNLYLASLQHKLSMLQYYEQSQKSHTEPEDQNLKSELASVTGEYKKALEARSNLQEAGFMSALDYYQNLEISLAQLRKDNAKLRSDYEALTKAVEARRNEFPQLAVKLQRLNALRRNILVTTDLYLAVKKKLQETAIQEAGTINDIAIVSPASVPSRSHALPLGMKLVFALTIALFTGLVAVLSKESLLPIIHDRYDLEREGLVVMGELPFSAKAKMKPTIVVNDMPHSFEKEAFRSMRMRFGAYLDSYVAAAGAKVVLVTSPKHGNGKTFTTVNLACVLAKAHYRVLVMDLDLINPTVDRYFEAVEKHGTVGILAGIGRESKEQVVTRVNPYLDVVFGNNMIENPGDFLDSDVISKFVAQQREKYDYILIDSPPVLGMSEPVMIASVADIVMLVVEHRQTYREDVVLTSEALNDVYNKPLVAVINGVHKEFTHQPYLKKYRPGTSPSATAI